jgi:hypothetical protein
MNQKERETKITQKLANPSIAIKSKPIKKNNKNDLKFKI